MKVNVDHSPSAVNDSPGSTTQTQTNQWLIVQSINDVEEVLHKVRATLKIHISVTFYQLHYKW
jgi:hypothetical protein